MYENYWQLQRKPFRSHPDVDGYYPTEVHQGALLKLRYAIESRASAALLCGAAGTGKTLLIELLRRQTESLPLAWAYLSFPQLSPVELLWYLADELQCDPVSQAPTAEQTLRRLEKRLGQLQREGTHAVVVVDDAHLLEMPAALDTLRLLLNFAPQCQPALTLILSGHPLLLPTLDRHPEFEQRLSMKCLLRPLTADETASYVSHQLRVAGTNRAIFEPNALEALHQFAQGNPRRVNRLADLALLIGYAEDRDALTATEVEGVAQELVSAVAA